VGPYLGKVVNTHRRIFLGSKGTRVKATWGGNFTPPPLDSEGLIEV